MTNENLLKLGEKTTKLAQTASTRRIQARALNRLSMLEIQLYFALVLIL